MNVKSILEKEKCEKVSEFRSVLLKVVVEKSGMGF